MIKKILIVDDSPIARKMLKSVLPKGTEFKIEEAVDGEDGINKYAAFKPDITFLDLTMPMKDGFQAIAEIKDADPQAMIVVLTADIQQKSISRALGLGAFSLLRKPPTAASISDAMTQVEAVLHARREE